MVAQQQILLAYGYSAAVLQFLARTSGLDGTHTSAYQALIDGLVADGVWAKLDMLHIYATQNSTTANLNLIGNIYNATPINSPPFTVDRGYTSSEASAQYIDTGFNPTTAVSPKLTQNSAHISEWLLSDINTTRSLVIGHNNASTYLGIHARFSNSTYMYLNSGTSVVNVASANSLGHFLGNRNAVSSVQGYKNGSQIITDTIASNGLVNSSIIALGQNQNGTLFGSNYQGAMASIGSSLSSTDATNFYNRLRTYMTAVGVP